MVAPANEPKRDTIETIRDVMDLFAANNIPLPKVIVVTDLPEGKKGDEVIDKLIDEANK